MSDEKIVVELTLEDGKYSIRMKGASADARALAAEVKRLDKSMHRVSKSTGIASSGLLKWTVIIGQSRNAIHQLWFVTGQWMNSLIKTSSEIEKMTSLMRGMSDAATEVGKSAEAASNVGTLFEMAANAPFTINALSDSFVKFKSVGIDPLNGSMGSLVDAVAAFGGTDETLHRASIAIQQMAGKGVISMEELRQQLGEAVPQAITIMAQSMGTTYGKLVDEISKGNVEAGPALEAMFTGFEIAFGGRAQNLMDNYSGRIAKMKTAWVELVTESSGINNYFEEVKDSISEITDLLNSRFAMDFMDGLGNAISSVVRGFTYLVQNVGLAWGKVQAFFNLMNEASLQPGNILYAIREELEREVALVKQIAEGLFKITGAFGGDKPTNFGDFILNPFGLFKQEDVDKFQNTLAQVFMGAEDTADIGNKMLKQRLIQQSDILETELGSAQDVFDNHSKAIANKTREINQARMELNRAIVSNTASNPLGDGEIFSQEQVDALKDRVSTLDRVLIEIDTSRQNIQKKIQETVAARDSGQMWQGQAERELAELEERNRQQIARYTSFYEEKKAIVDRIANIKPPEITYDEFGDEVVQGSVDRLAQLAESTDVSVQAAARSLMSLRGEMSGMVDDANAMADTITGSMNDVADGLADPFIEEMEDFRFEMGALGSEALSDIQDAMTDTAGTAESRFERASEIANEFFDTQAAGYVAIGEVAQIELAKQRDMGLEAAAIVATQIAEMLKAIEERRASILKTITLGSKPGFGSGGSSGGSSGGKSAGQRSAEKLKDLIEDANKEAEELGKRFVNPFAYELPKAIDKAKDKIDKLAEDISGGKWTGEMRKLFDTMATNAMTEEMIKMAEATRSIERSLMGERQARKEIYEEEKDRIKEMKAKLIEMGIWRVEWEGTIQAQLLALKEEFESKSPMGEWMNEWKNIYEDIEKVGADTMKSLSQGMADMVTEGKADFASLARSAVNSLLQVSFNAGLSGLANMLKGSLGGGGGGIGSWFSKILHSGGIVGAGGRGRSVNMSDFSNAQRYHTGGVIGQEVPAILEKGEGVFTAAQMKALGGGMSKGQGDVKVNLINNSGQPLDSEKGNVRIDPNGMVLDIVLKAVKNPGPFRDSMKGALSK